MAMIVSTLTEENEDPGTAAAWSLSHGFYTPENGRTKDEFFPAFGAEYGIVVTGLTDGDLRDMPAAEAEKIHEEAYAAVEGGDWVIAFMGEGKWTTGGHFVLWYDVDGDDVLIRDSNSKKEYKARNKLDVFRETVIRYWVVEVPADA
jgi:hypothetical protein